MKKFLYYLILFFLFLKSIYAEDINDCIKDAIKLSIELNKILTICRENIQNIEIYKNSYSQNKIQKNSEYISTNKADEIIYEMIKSGDLKNAARLATRMEAEKTKRIKSRAEAEALRSPQIISNLGGSNNQEDLEKNLNIRSVLSLNINPLRTSSSGSKIIEVTTPSTHGGIPGQYVTLSNVTSSVDGIAASELNTRHIISSVPSVNTFTITVLSSALLGSVSGGGSNIVATFEN
ncbi:hypothetical protein OA264_00330 [Alphaproteobacteria bacterium]|nr:hypothetical protein [Alphaproteobacteria bacterium]